MYNNVIIGKKMRTIRLKLGLDQKAAAEKIGCSVTALSRYENGIRMASRDMLSKIADAYNVPYFALVDCDSEDSF